VPLPVRPRGRVTVAALAAAAAIAVPVSLTALPAGASGNPAPDPTFHRINVGASISGASFTSVGEVFAGEKNIVTSGYGWLDANGRPVGGGTLQVYRMGADLTTWTKVTVFGPSAEIVFPNSTTIDDVDGDGDNDIIVPSGYFFGTDPAFDPMLTGAITWWENAGPGAAFVQHTVISGQAGSYHGVQLVDLDGDGEKDLVSTSEEAKEAGNQYDDTIAMQFFKGDGAGGFAAPVSIADVGGSQPVVADVDGDGDLDIASSQYFSPFQATPTASFLWLENGDTDDTITSGDFTKRTIATILNTVAGGRGVGMGFQIRPVPDFREPGKVSWIGTNHVNRCTIPAPFSTIPEEVIEFIPGSDIRQQWSLKSLSAPAAPSPSCPSSYKYSDEPEFSDAITARWGYGQGAPGVFGYGDLDGDGDVDLAVSGDGDRRLWWVENNGDGTTTLHRLTAPGDYFGQAGGAVVVDLDGDGRNEIVFSSFDRNTLAVWTRDEVPEPEVTPTPTTVTVPSSIRVGPETRTVKAGRKATWSVRFTGAPGGARRTVSVLFDPVKGKSVKVGTVRLTATNPAGTQKGSFSFKVRSKGRFVVSYSGTSVSKTLRDTGATDTARVLIRRR
jgi:hypothetical protein